MNALERLYTSTAALYERFGLDANSTPPSRRRRIFLEEVGELLEASTWAEDVDRDYAANTVADEAADVIVTVLGLCQSHGIPLDEIAAACERVAAKNDQKTHETHRMVGGKITRKVAQEAHRE